MAKVLTAVRLDAALLAAMDTLAAGRGITRTEIFSQALTAYVDGAQFSVEADPVITLDGQPAPPQVRSLPLARREVEPNFKKGKNP